MKQKRKIYQLGKKLAVLLGTVTITVFLVSIVFIMDSLQAQEGFVNRAGIVGIGTVGSNDCVSFSAGEDAVNLGNGSRSDNQKKPYITSLALKFRRKSYPFSIVFVSERDGNKEIYKMGFDGSRQERLTDNKYSDSSPKWSPDKTQITFVRVQGKNYDIFIMDGNGKNEKRLTNNPARDYDPVWSPDGKKIAFIRNHDTLIVIDTIGGKEKIIVRQDQIRGHCWSPDNKKIAFCFHEFQDVRQIFVKDIGTGKQKYLFSYNQAGSLFPAWSPDGSELAYRRLYHNKHGIWKWKVNINDAAGAGMHTKLAKISTYSGSSGRFGIKWSTFVMRNRLSKIAYGDLKHGRTDIYIVNSDGSENINLTDGRFVSIESFDWNDPVGSHIILSGSLPSRSSGLDIFRIQAKKTRRGVKIKQLTNSPGNDSQPDF